MPLTRMLSQYFNWQVDYLFLIVLMIIAFIYFLNFLPSVKTNQNQINFKSELALLKNKETLFVLFSSLITFIGYGSLFTYVTPYLLELFPKVDHILSYYLIIMGLACFSGNLCGGYISDRIGFKKALLIGTAIQMVLTGLIFVFQNQMWITLILILLWQFMGWFIGLQLNTGINITTQNKSSFILNLNSSNIQLGQAFGLSIAVFIIKSFGIQSLSLLTLSSTLLILLISTILKEKT
nr:MFS transporter [Streptococcus penaeicida]